MTFLTTDWTMGKCLEWCTQLPLKDRPQTSPVFFIHNVECHFYFCRSLETRRNFTDYSYYMYLQTKAKDAQLKSFSFTIYADINCGISSKFESRQATFQAWEEYVFSFSERPLLKNTVNLSAGLPIRYLFVFEHNAGLLLPSEMETDEKSTQADLMLSVETDMEYLSLDFSELLKSRKHSDMQLVCNGGNIMAHKAILACRSKAFSDMFEDGSEESKSGLVNMSTTEMLVMELCLEYIYKGKIVKLPVQKASDLYVLGHDLKIPSLTKMCADLMAANSSEENYISYLVLAEKYDDDPFKKGLMDYICNHVDLLKSESWVKFSDNNPKTANDVHRQCLLKMLV